MVSEGHGGKRIYPVVASEYKLFEEVGQGVTATVYRAHCLPYNETVAIKKLDLEKCNSNLVTFSNLLSLQSVFHRSKHLCSSVKFALGARVSNTFERDSPFLKGITNPSHGCGLHRVEWVGRDEIIQ